MKKVKYTVWYGNTAPYQPAHFTTWYGLQSFIHGQLEAGVQIHTVEKYQGD